MANISKIITLNGTEYDICDAVARATLSGAILIKGATTTALEDEATTNPITINEESYTAVANDAVFYNHKEFVFDGQKWHEFGDMTGLGSLATKNSASTTYTPAGTVSQPTFSGNSLTSSGNFTPNGSVSAPTITVTPTTENDYVASSSTGGGSVVAGTAASCSMPVLTTTVSNEILTLGWTDGSFTANTPTSVTLPSFTQKTLVNGIDSATATAPTFTGTEGEVSVSGTPTGTVSQPTFTGTQATITVS